MTFSSLDPGGYLLSVEPDQVDVLQFEQLLEEGRRSLAAGEPEAAEKLLSGALSHWRGRPLADIAFEPVALAETGRLEQLRLDAVEAQAEARLALGFDAEVVHELEPLVRDQPLRERLRGQLMLALYRAGRQADALAVYQEGRRRLVDELGIEPGSDLQQLQRAVLHHAGELDRPDDHTAPTGSAPESSATAPAVVREQRKVVSVVFCDVGESALVREHPDPEALRVLLARCFERVRSIVERFGGTVERFVGDTAIAVFGVPAVHEDDALRAVHAAAEIRDALRELGVEARIGADTGEVVTGTDQGLAVGEVVHAAAGLQQEARPGEVLLGKETLALVEAAVEAERVERPGYRGSAEPPSAFPLRHVYEAPNLRRESRFVGRGRELTTIVGEAGVGKTRLVAEFLSRLEATVIRVAAFRTATGSRTGRSSRR